MIHDSNTSDFSDLSDMTDLPAASGSSSGGGDGDATPARKKTTKKKTTKTASKAAAKKTTKKSSAKAAEKPADKPAEKTTKKVAKKAASKKVTKKAAAKAAEAAETEEPETAPFDEAPEPVEPAGDEPRGDEGAADRTGDRTDDGDDRPGDAESAGGEGEATKKKRRRRRKKSGVRAEGTPGDAPDTDTPGEGTGRRDKPAPRGGAKPAAKAVAAGDDDEAEPAYEGHLEMVINYVPGEECRVAITEDGQLEEFFAEPTDRVSRVGNIYVGKVINVEASIQAAFVDFGCEENGFLHISDLHPQYFGDDDEATERVGKKTPRRDRPPIQEALRRGQEITVAVLKEGVGTKGPTLTSYLSIPGRFLVMMPGMDKVGVSRKEEDDERRRAAKEILSQLDLPEGFGFILRTAGFDRTKAELKRDLAYLMRLWKDMERRRKGGNKPRPLYSESDLLLRSIRDLMTSDIRRVVIDSESALKRAAQFIKIAAPRAQAKLARYVGGAPIFHAFGIEEQIDAIHAREVPLPSGGRLVIDQTEALVAIDVNSGKSRSARDAETNAFRTNMEAVDAICRQLRLRDLGGLVVNDLIDMRYSSHRKQVEQRFIDRLKRDRAKSTVGQISEFGLLEMTRQRMRGSMESQHFADCPMCHGRGLVQKPDSVAAIALRDMAAIIDHEKVRKVEMVVHPRVAGALLSTRRTALTRIELHSGKQVEVRVSEALPIDRVTFYAYDHAGADLTLEKVSGRRRPDPKVIEWVDDSPDDWAVDPSDEADETTAQKLAEEIARLADEAAPKDHPAITGEDDEDDRSDEGSGGKKKRRRRRRRGGKGRAEGDGSDTDGRADTPARDGDNAPAERGRDEDADDRDEPESASDGDDRDGDGAGESGGEEGGEGGKKKRRRRRRRGRGRREDGEAGEGGRDERGEASDGSRREPRSEPRPAPRAEPRPEPKPAPAPTPVAEAKPKRRGLYSAGRRKLAPSEVARISPE
jgi:ribonuclease E